ncbi:hypothetical protein BK816_03395 [Boudabousia tangfeifanii]|uniref:Glycosyltransferase 2-like domain-containing protein n=1 Tax=Boudabousia tangfeifanii TaxID=1912795 RepID=A0A1D9MJH2_9ACTO|nr:glycosyltransferase [Boudabousia tangfeifanii]AOZ72455.1 hypothetical protein BK816_03395 [Boudabousia tangfeifanii]
MSDPWLVHAFIVTAGATNFLDYTVHAVQTQTRAPQTVTIVDVRGDESVAELAQKNNWSYFEAPEATNLGAAINLAWQAHPEQEKIDDRAPLIIADDGSAEDTVEQAAENEPAFLQPDLAHVGTRAVEEKTWLWVLHDDSPPETDCLEQMLFSLDRVRSVAVVGAKQRDWYHPRELLEVGIRATRHARRVDFWRGELDQGQHDHIEDVLAVSTAGMLVNAQVWQTVGGTDPALTVFGEGLEFGRRLHLLGYRVIVQSKAVCYHAQATYLGVRRAHAAPDAQRSFAPRRFAQLYNWVLATPTWQLPFLLLLLPFWTLARAFARLIARQPALALAELEAFIKLVMASGTILSRRKSYPKQVSAKSLSRLEAHPGLLRRARWENWRIQQDGRNAIQIEPVAAAGMKARREYAQLAAVFVIAVPLVLSIYFFSSRIYGFTGGATYQFSSNYRTWWDYAWSGWNQGNLGTPVPADPLLSLISLVLSGGYLVGISLSTMARIAWLLAMPLAAISAWKAAGTLTRAVPLRIWASFAWIALPTFWISWAQGRLSVMVLAVFLPLTFWGLMRGTRFHKAEVVAGARRMVAVRTIGGETRFFAIAAIGQMFVVAAWPALLGPMWLATIILTLFTPFRRWSVFATAIPATIQVTPFVLTAFAYGHTKAVLGTIDRPLAFEAPSVWDILTLWPLNAHELEVSNWAWWTVAIVLSIAFACVLSLLRTGKRGWFVRIAIGAGLLSLYAALYLRNQPIAATDRTVFVYPGLALTIATAFFLIAGVAGLDRYLSLSAKLPQFRAFTRVSAALAAVLVVLVPLSFTAKWGNGINSVTKADSGPFISASAQLSTQGPAKNAVLLLTPKPKGEVQAQIWHDNGATYLEHNAILDYRELIQRQNQSDYVPPFWLTAIATLRAGQDNPNLANELAVAGIGQVVLKGHNDAEFETVRTRLDQTDGLTYIGQTEAGETWRVVDPETLTASGNSAVRVRLVTEDGSKMIPSGAITAKGEIPAPGTVSLAQTPDVGWWIKVNGQSLAVTEGKVQTFVAEEAGHIRLGWSRPWLRLWQISLTISYLVLASGLLVAKRGRV